MRDEYIRKAVVTRVIDGDTFEAEVDLGYHIKFTHKYRVLDLDTPETFRPKLPGEREAGRRATSAAENLLMGLPVHIKSTKAGKYGRYLAAVTLPDGRDFSSVMKELGHVKKEQYDTAGA